MKCPSCGHENLTDFPFCEQCLTLLPRPSGEGSGAFDLDESGLGAGQSAGPAWPPFPWNADDLPDPLIGREKALNQLKAGWDAVVKNWRGRIHLLVSEYGMGKSRVGSALAAAALSREPDTRVIRVECPAHGGAYRMWDALLRETFEIPASADDVEAGAHLVKAVSEHLPDDGPDTPGLIAHLTGWDAPNRPRPSAQTSEESLVGRSSGALARLLAAVSADRPVLMIVDQANRASTESLALAGAMEATLKGRPFMLVLTGAPELTEILPGWSDFPMTELSPLSRRDAEQMLRLFLDGLGEPPKELVKRILDRAGGNPFAIKSMVRYLREAGGIVLEDDRWCIDEGVVWDLELPEDLEGVVLARIGALAAADRRTMANAAVVGKHFWLGALVSLERQEVDPVMQPGDILSDGVPASIRSSLDRLVALKFVERAPSRLQGEEAFAFSSDVAWRLASSMLPAATRQRLHRIIGQWLLCQAGYSSAEQLEDLARHAESAGEAQQAGRYLVEAARRYRARHVFTHERALLLNAKALVPESDIATRVTVAFDLGDALRLIGDLDGALREYQEALQLAWKMRQRRQGAKALQRIGRVEMDRGAMAKAREHLVPAVRLMEKVKNYSGLAAACNDLGRFFWLQGKFEEALRAYRKAETIYRQLKDRRGLAETVHLIAAHHYDRGDLSLAEEYYTDALDLRRKVDDRHGLARTLNDLGIVWMTGGEIERAGEAWSEALDFARTIGDRAMEATLANNLGEGLMMLGRFGEAEDHLQRAIELAKDLGMPRIAVDAWLNLGSLRAKKSKWDEAEEALEQARSLAADLSMVRLTAMVDRGYGDLMIAMIEASPDASDEDRNAALERAQAAYLKSGEDLERQKYDLEAALSFERLADAYRASGNAEGAIETRKRAALIRASHHTSVQVETE